MKHQQRLFSSALSFFLLFFFLECSTTYSANLWEGEELRHAAGYPAITRFIKGEEQKPLVVLIPGAHHMARIFYGDAGRYKEDFLTYWLNNLGYNVLAISYPVDTPSKAFDGTFPDFTTQAWGEQAATIAKQVLQENNLTGKVIVCGWSMAGKSAQPFQSAATKIGIDVDFFVALAATPPTLGNITMKKSIPMFSTGLADRTGDIPKWYKHVDANAKDNGGRTIIPWEIYQAEYTGAISIQQQSYGLRYKKGTKEFIRDFWADLEDTKPYDFDNFPLIAIIQPNSPMDSRHALTDEAEWGLYIAQKILRDSSKKTKLDQLPEDKWRSLIELTRSAPERMSIEIPGNHFFFVGEFGARKTATAINQLVEKIHSVQAELDNIWGTQPK